MNTDETLHKKFITKFVGVLYAILIGIGITNVIFTLELSIENWFRIVLALFVTVIVALYWWDWASYVEKQFIATPAEFGIDFAGLIVLEFLFVHFQEPVKLAATFLALGVVDFFWVINHIRQSPEQSYKLRKWWIVQKVLGLTGYGTGFFMVIWLQHSFSTVQLGAIVMLTALLVRIFCFRDVRRENILTFRAALPDDVTQISAINRAYLEDNLDDAFLLEELSEPDLNKLLTDRPARLYAATKGTAVMAYTKVDWKIDENILSSLIWLDPHLEQGVRNRDILHIEQVAVNPVHDGRGIGRSFYRWLLKKHSELLPCAFVALHPRCNAASIRFHAAVGFEKAAVFRSDMFLGQRNYQSLLYVFSARLPASGG